MLTDLESGLGLEIVIWLQDHSNIVLVRLAQFLNLAGSGVFYLLAIIALALYWDKGTIWRLAAAVILAALMTEFFKELAGRPRPYQAYPDKVMMFFYGTRGHGLPSGHVSNAIVFWGLITIRLRQARLWIAVGAYVALLGWSRMVGGVHYPQDVLSGLLLGFVYLWVFSHFLLPTSSSRQTPQSPNEFTQG